MVLISKTTLLACALFLRVASFGILVVVMQIALKELKIKDRVKPLRISFVFLIIISMIAIAAATYTNYCRFDHCYNELNLDAISFLVSLGNFSFSLLLLFMYKKKIHE